MRTMVPAQIPSYLLHTIATVRVGSQDSSDNDGTQRSRFDNALSEAARARPHAGQDQFNQMDLRLLEVSLSDSVI